MSVTNSKPVEDDKTKVIDKNDATAEKLKADAKAKQEELQKPADIPSTGEFSPSGAARQVVPDVDPSHPAVDDNPRRNTTIEQNKIDFNDPTKSDSEAVAENLNRQGVPTKAETGKA